MVMSLSSEPVYANSAHLMKKALDERVVYSNFFDTWCYFIEKFMVSNMVVESFCDYDLIQGRGRACIPDRIQITTINVVI